MRWIRSWCPEEGWLRQWAPMLSINLTKQGYRLILVPATGVIWSTVWSTIAEGASGMPPHRDTVHEPDLRLGFEYRQRAASACLGQT